MRDRCGLAVLVSGSGTNLQAILDASRDPSYPAEVRVVISNVPEAAALARARKAGITALCVSPAQFSGPDFDKELIRIIDESRVTLVILAGFMKILSPFFVQHYPNRILNIHPALLPAFPGTHAIRRAWEAKVPVTGVTVHFVDEGVDTGPMILQEEVPISPGESLESLESLIHKVEHRLYPKAIRQVIQKEAL